MNECMHVVFCAERLNLLLEVGRIVELNIHNEIDCELSVQLGNIKQIMIFSIQYKWIFYCLFLDLIIQGVSQLLKQSDWALIQDFKWYHNDDYIYWKVKR